MAPQPRPDQSLLEDAPQQPIGDYAAIGDCRTLALVSKEGSIDWWCLPHFSGPSIFGALLDRREGGRFALRPRDIEHIEQRYLYDSNVLETTFQCSGGVLRLIDAMTMPAGEPGAVAKSPHELLRIAHCTQGQVQLEAVYAPRPDYARSRPALRRHGDTDWLCDGCDGTALLRSDLPFTALDAGTLYANETLTAGDERQCAVIHAAGDVDYRVSLGAPVRERMDATLRWWSDWCSQCCFDGEYRHVVMRSCLTLKLLTYSPSGAIVAASTTSIPASDSGARNWDYRYCWLRDTSMVLQSFADMGFRGEADAFLHWLLHATRSTRPRLRVMYDVCGGDQLQETELTSLRGHAGLGPVRIGNGAHDQLQLDIYGEMLLTACGFVARGGVLAPEERELLAGIGRTVCKLWRQPDSGIWEIRGPARHNTYSKLMCWVALDRLIDLHHRIDMGIDEAAMTAERAAIRADIESNGFHTGHNSYVGFYGGETADASLLLFARYGFLSVDDPRMVGTCRYIEQTLSAVGLLYRYPPDSGYDGLPGDENAFVICSYWLVDYLARRGDIDRAEAMFDRLIKLGNHVDLFAEQVHIRSRTPMGNFPQAFSHVGVIIAAYALKEAQQGKRDTQIAR